ncbi:MAG: hypothetical protein M5U12_09420 [Verrucomicrobia bacterium]|nr:hypothetical protein [Verrucomicrobiota bacterium]
MESQSPSGGHGARWPHPGVFFDAIHVALWRAFAEPAGHGFAQHSFYGKRNGQRQRLRNGGTFFQTLATAGPFPVREAQWLFSAPADAQPGGGALHPITQDQAESDLPKPLRHPLGSNSTPSKVPVPPWWSREAMHAHLTGSGATQTAWSADDLFAEEWSTGIGSDPATGTQDGQRIYSAQYLRLRDTVRLGLSATLPEAAHGEGLDQLFRIGTPTTIVVGGQLTRLSRRTNP